MTQAEKDIREKFDAKFPCDCYQQDEFSVLKKGDHFDNGPWQMREDVVSLMLEQRRLLMSGFGEGKENSLGKSKDYQGEAENV